MPKDLSFFFVVIDGEFVEQCKESDRVKGSQVSEGAMSAQKILRIRSIFDRYFFKKCVNLYIKI
jgi:hypothetical protein